MQKNTNLRIFSKKSIFLLSAAIIITFISVFIFIKNINKPLIDDPDIFNYTYLAYHTSKSISSFNLKNILDTKTFYPNNKFSMLICDPSMITNCFALPFYIWNKDNPNFVFNGAIILMTFITALTALFAGYFYFKSITAALLFSIFVNQFLFRTGEYARWHAYFSGFIILIVFSMLYLIKSENRANIIKYSFILCLLFTLQFYSSIYLFFTAIHILPIAYIIFLSNRQYQHIKYFSCFMFLIFVFILPFILLNLIHIKADTYNWHIDQYNNISNIFVDILRYISNLEIPETSNSMYLRINAHYIALLIPILLFYKYTREKMIFPIIMCIVIILLNTDVIYKNLINYPLFKQFRNYNRIMHLFNICFAVISVNCLITGLKKINKPGRQIILLIYFLIFIWISAYPGDKITLTPSFFLKTKQELDKKIIEAFENKQNSVLLFLPIGPAYDVFYLNYFIFISDNLLVNGFTQHFNNDYVKLYNILNTYPSNESIERIQNIAVDYILINQRDIFNPDFQIYKYIAAN